MFLDRSALLTLFSFFLKVSLLKIRNKALSYEQSRGTNLILEIPWIHVPVIDFNMYHDEKDNESKLS